MTTHFIDRLISGAMGESPLIIPYLGPDNLPESLNLSDTFFVTNDHSIEKVPGSHPSLDEKTDNVRHIEKNYSENNTSGEIYEDHNSPIDEWSQPILPPSQPNISTDHDTELKEDYSYIKPPLNKSTSCETSIYTSPQSTQYINNHDTELKEDYSYIKPPLNKSTPAKPVSILPPSQPNISTDHDTELKEDYSYIKPPLNKSTPAKPVSILPPSQPNISTDHDTELKEDYSYIKPPLNKSSCERVSILPPSQHNISTDHDTELKEDSSYIKPPLNKSTPAKPKSDILPEFDLGDDSNKEPRIRRPIIFDILNNSRDVDDQHKNQDLKGNLDITTFTDPPSKLTRQNQPRAIPKENRLNIIRII